MQNFKKYSFIVLFATIFSQAFEPGLGNFISTAPTILNTQMGTETSNFTMNHGFSLMVNSGKFGSTSMGAYANQAKYNFSDRLSLNSTIQFINSNHSIYTNNQKFDLKYEFGFEYKLSENSRIFFQFSDFGQPRNNRPYMFTPGF